MFIWFGSRMGHYRDEEHREYAPHFINHSMFDCPYSAIPKRAETSLLIPTDHPMSLVSYVLKTKRLDTLSYLQKEHPHLSSPFISLAITRPPHSPPSPEAQPTTIVPPTDTPTDTLSVQTKFRKRIRFKLKISSKKSQRKTDMEFTQLKPKSKLTIKYGKSRPINDQRSAGTLTRPEHGSKRGKSKRSYGSSALDFRNFFGIKKVRNIKTNFIDPTALNMKDIKYI